MNWNYIGNNRAVQAVKTRLHAGSASKSYLITGPTGIGRRTFAIRLAQEIWCANLPAPVEDSKPYLFLEDANPMWRTAVRRGHPHEEEDPPSIPETAPGKKKERKLEYVITAHNDLHVLRRHDSKQGITVDGVRDWISGLYLKPATQPMRIGILDAADQMRAEAVDTLLKTLEEPTEHTLLILIAPSIHDVPPTITSRCHVIDLCPVPSDSISEHLINAYAIDPDLASHIAETSTGRPGWAIRMAQDPAAWDTHCSGRQEAMAFESASTAVRFATAGNLLSRRKLVVQREEAHGWLNTLELEQSHTLRNAMQSHTTTATPEDQTRLHAAIGRLLRTTETRRAIAANVSPQLALEDLALRPISESVLPSSESHDRH
jgi:DNA polymerase-3 subunit delta'